MNVQRSPPQTRYGTRSVGSDISERKTEGGRPDQLIGDQDGAKCKQGKTVNDVCPGCKLRVHASAKALECNLCEIWHHITCEGVSEAVYSFLVQNEESALHWYCSKCNNVVGKVVKQMSMISKRQNEMEKRLDDFEKETEEGLSEVREDLVKLKEYVTVNGSSGEVKDLVKKELDEVKTKVLDEFQSTMKKEFDAFVEITSEKVEKQIRESAQGILGQFDDPDRWQKKVEEKVYTDVKEKVRSEVKEDLVKSYSEVLRASGMESGAIPKYTERKEDILESTTRVVQGRMERKNNIVLYKVPEKVAEEMDLSIRAEKTRHDKMVFMDLCKELGLTCYDSDIEEIRRIGRYVGESDSKPRPLLVSLRGYLKERIMRNLYKLRDSENDIFKKVGVTHDMTREERKKDLELKEEAKNRNENEQNSGNYYIVRGNPWNRYIQKVKRWQMQEAKQLQKVSGKMEEKQDSPGQA